MMERFFEKITFKQFKNDICDDKKLYESYNIPERKTESSAGYDFLAIEDFEIKPGEIKKIPTGIKAKFNQDEILLIVVRSSMGFKYNIRMCNQVGVIDCEYYNNPDNEGHIWIALQNEGSKVYSVRKNDGIAQGLFIKYLTTGEEVTTKRKGWSGKPKKGE